MFQVVVTAGPWVQILPASPGRQMLTITAPANNGPTVYLQFDGSTVALSTGNGMPLAPGASITSNPDGPGCDMPYAVNAVVASGSAVLCIQEAPASK